MAEARFVGESRFDWNLFQGFDKLRVLTYSASIPAIVRMLDEFGLAAFECVFGSEATLRDVKYILAFQQVAVGDVRAAIMGLKDERHSHILSEVRLGRARFRVLRQSIAHANLYLLEDSARGRTRVIVGSVNLSERAFSGLQPETLVKFDDALVRSAAELMVEYFRNFENFEGDVDRLQRDYFILWSWMYFSPFKCDVRSLALIRGRDVIRYPSFGIVFGKSNCGKTSLLDTLMTSMLRRAHNVEKANFTAARLPALQQGFKRHPVVFHDIGGRAFRTKGSDMIKDVLLPPVAEYPGFVLSMNLQHNSFPDEIVKRSLMIYTTTALPQYDEELRQRMDDRIKDRLNGLLRPSAMAGHEGETPNGWTIENDRIIVWEQRDAFVDEGLTGKMFRPRW